MNTKEDDENQVEEKYVFQFTVLLVSNLTIIMKDATQSFNEK